MKRTVNKFVKIMQQKGLTLALAESVTCGLAASKLTTAKGTTNVLRCSIVCYQPEMKQLLLQVPKSLIKKNSCESQPVTTALAKGLKKKVPADVYAALTGLAAPGGSESSKKPVGTIFISVIFKNKIFEKRTRFYGNASEVKDKACLFLYEYILSLVQ